MEQRITTIKEDPSLGKLFSELANETSTLVRQEISLAQAELTHKATIAGKQGTYLAVGAAIAYAGVLAIVAGLVMLLAIFLPAWASAIVVGLAVGFAGYLTISHAMDSLKRVEITPTETVKTLKEDARWLKKQMT